MKNENKTNNKREEKKQIALKKFHKSKDKLIHATKGIYESLTKVVLIHKEEVTEQLLAKIKEAIEKVEKKK